MRFIHDTTNDAMHNMSFMITPAAVQCSQCRLEQLQVALAQLGFHNLSQ